MTAALEAYRPWLIAMTLGLLGLAFYVTYRPGRPVASSPWMRANKVMLWVVTAAVLFLLVCPQYATGWLTDDGEFTADMRRSVLTVEGMTCPG